MKYPYNDNTLFHSVGFNLERMTSILDYGILSKNEALKNNITYSNNYLNFKSDDDISLTRYLYINPNVELSSYNLYLKRGIAFIVEDVDFIYDKDDTLIHRSDEVLVKKKIPLDKIKGITIPLEYYNLTLDKLPIIPFNITSYNALKLISDNYVAYLKNNNHNIDRNYYLELFQDIRLTNNAIASLKNKNIDNNDIDYKESILYYKELMGELNEFLALESFICFSKILKKEATLIDTINYIMSNHKKLEIYNVPFEYVKRR